MQNQKTKLISLSGLIHDIGKMLERGRTKCRIPENEFNSYVNDVCKEKNGHPAYLHAAFTLWFCNFLEERFNCLRDLNGSLKNWKYWSSGHHRNDPDIECRIIKKADILSSSEREQGDFYIRNVNRRTLLEPVIERVFLWENNRVSTMHRYPLKPIDSEKNSCFPQNAESLGLEIMEAPDSCTDKGKWKHLLSKETLEDDYEKLCQGLLDEVTALSEEMPAIDIDNLYVTLFKLIEKYTSNVPSATNLRHPDISLFDHLRTTASISECMYLYSLQEGASIEDITQWTLACGDFSGIQKFIYNLTNKGAAKGLKGRSFYVQFFCRICSDFILRELGLSKASCLYNSGGKFYLMLPVNLQGQLYALRDKINEQLLDEFGGEVFLGLGTHDVNCSMFEQGGMHEAWKAMAENLANDRQRKFKSQINHEFFKPDFVTNPTKSCNVCGSRKHIGGQDRCSKCDLLQNIGKHLGDTEALLCVWDTTSTLRIIEKLGLKDERVVPFRFNKNKRVDVLFVSENQVKRLKNICNFDGECIFLGGLSDKPLTDPDVKIMLPQCALSSLYLAKWRKTTEDWDFDSFTNESKGLKRLGILRMDVDNLGLVFIRGLKFLKHQEKGWGAVEKNENGLVLRESMASISRMATLSRQLNHFFSAWFPRMMREGGFERSQIIYAGGDDLFVIGSWDELPQLAKTIRDEFIAFCCGNIDFGISGGISLQKGKYPIYKGAQIAGDAEEKAKNLMKDWAGIKTRKDCLTFLGVSIPWRYFDAVEEIKGNLIDDQAREKNKGLLSYLMKTVEKNNMEAARKTRRLGLKKAWDDVTYYPWRWRLNYFLKRRYSSKTTSVEKKKWIDIILGNNINGIEKDGSNLIPVITWLGMPLKWVHNLNRNKEEE